VPRIPCKNIKKPAWVLIYATAAQLNAPFPCFCHRKSIHTASCACGIKATRVAFMLGGKCLVRMARSILTQVRVASCQPKDPSLRLRWSTRLKEAVWPLTSAKYRKSVISISLSMPLSSTGGWVCQADSMIQIMRPTKSITACSIL